MKKKWLITLSVAVGLGMMAGFAGCASKSLRFKSEQDEAVANMIRQTLVNFESAYNKQDVGGILPSFYENGQIVNEGRIKIFSREQFFKGQFAGVFPETFKKFPSMTLGSAYAFLVLPSRDKAVMELITAFGKTELRTKVSMILDGDRWLIVKTLYWSEK